MSLNQRLSFATRRQYERELRMGTNDAHREELHNLLQSVKEGCETVDEWVTISRWLGGKTVEEKITYLAAELNKQNFERYCAENAPEVDDEIDPRETYGIE